MELGQVEAFVEANRRGSISRAADALGLTQPTCTARLHGLERELGAQLLVRGRRGVSLTPAGRRFLPRAIAAMESLRRGASEAKAGSEARLVPTDEVVMEREDGEYRDRAQAVDARQVSERRTVVASGPRGPGWHGVSADS